MLLTEKITRIDSLALQSGSLTGKMINLAANDIELFEQGGRIIMAFAAPIYVFIMSFILYFYIGLLGIFCAIAMVVLGFVAVILSEITKRMRGKIGLITD